MVAIKTKVISGTQIKASCYSVAPMLVSVPQGLTLEQAHRYAADYLVNHTGLRGSLPEYELFGGELMDHGDNDSYFVWVFVRRISHG